MDMTRRINPFTQVQAQSVKALTAPATPGTFVDSAPKASFKDIMVNMVKDTDRTLTEPDKLMSRALSTGDVDLHEVMIANTKADLAISIISQVATKVIQAYERVQQIQV
jgi:flagellar hook-basal body complex protein FliE